MPEFGLFSPVRGPNEGIITTVFPMKFIVCIGTRSKSSRPANGPFLWSREHSRHVWKRRECATAKELADTVNEASAFLQRLDDSILRLEVIEVDASGEAVIEPAEDPSVSPNESSGETTRRLRLLSKKPAI